MHYANLQMFLSAFLGFLVLSVSLSSCHRPDFPAAGSVLVSWEVISNTYSDSPQVEACFVLKNKGKVALTDKNWRLYWNQSPRSLLGSSSDKPVAIERISGDWYRMLPLEGFSLKPGESVTIRYENEHWWIKESDAPKGLYWVFADKNGTEHIAEVENFELIPFSRPEQLSRHLGDFVPVPTPEIIYEQNRSLFPVSANELLPLIPSPAKLKQGEGKIEFGRDLTIYYDEQLSNEAAILSGMLNQLFGVNPNLQPGKGQSRGSISLLLSDAGKKTTSNEAYHLSIGNNGNIAITGSGKAGVFYGVQSLIALAPPPLHKTGVFELPVQEIDDTPRFSYRGVHLDVARNFFEKEAVLKMIDVLAFYKINKLHLHLTEDEGWRIEIPALPELTEVGGKRSHTTKNAAALHPAYGSGPFAYDPKKTGSGFYSTSNFVEILQYAAKRHIQVIPEINMPGHSRAAIKAMEARYNYYMERGDETAARQFRLIDPNDRSIYNSAQFFDDNVVNVASESAYRFFETVLNALIAMYEQAGLTLEILHIGGDEVPHGAWTASPMIDELLPKLPHIGQAGNMHAHFHARVRDMLSLRNIRMGGWEEIALMADESGTNIPNMSLSGGQVIPYVWNNLWGAQDLAYKLANAGFPVVLCHVTNFYFDLAYNKDPKETGLYWAGFVDTYNAWHYNPFNVFQTTLHDNMGKPIKPAAEYRHMVRLNANARKNIKGLQAQLWSETIYGQEMLEYYLLPKLIGFAESAWAAERIWETTTNEALQQKQLNQGWNVFANTLAARELPRLAVLSGGYNYRIPTPGATLENGLLKANTAFPGLTIRFTTDGSEPGKNSQIIDNALKIQATEATLKAFDAAGRSSRAITVKDLRINP